mmetsp:Transcript_20966/g.45726  ORF Transcript_20966/g.45726 Transcript_20966/m.45726 type:complete len:210 (-) Transcript_20966:213-842(-)|eukprot:CAMPEP_0178496538 /NCGR_PEP_ID=MMETSP0696-20121128/14172_1 /TAXON_ID=265572 /ORGANISM="Extubocellulus spinifer, Strain CCMP396" /LENGTH=209 /DNA_ID=CAMNT_0020124831 /DNA_START=207 /DNA_END=836 /DNA_ORIENTATION=-
MGATKPIKDWTTEEVGQWLVAIGLGEKVEVFHTNAVSGDMLLDLEDDDLKGDLTLTSLQTKKFRKCLEFSKSIDASSQGGDGGDDAATVDELEAEIDKLKADLAAEEEKNTKLEEELKKLKVDEAPPEEAKEPAPAPAPAPPPQQHHRQGRPVVRGAAGGAARGAAMGAVAGAITGDAAQGAKVGAAVGATGGAMRGVGARRARRRGFG